MVYVQFPFPSNRGNGLPEPLIVFFTSGTAEEEDVSTSGRYKVEPR